MARVRGVLTAGLMVLVVLAAPNAARAALSGDMQGAIADLVNSAISAEDAEALSAAINDLCASHPDIKAEIVAAFAAELASRRPPGYCAGRIGPCLDLDSVMDTLLSNILVTYNTESGRETVAQRRTVTPRDTTGECGNSDCSLVEPPRSSSPSPAEW